MADLVQAVGTVLDIKWIHEGTVRSGTFCTTQGMLPQFMTSQHELMRSFSGVIQQLGETPVAMNTLVRNSALMAQSILLKDILPKVIAIHTFVTVWWGKALHARLIALGVVTWLVRKHHTRHTDERICSIWVYVAIFIAVGVTSRGTSDAPYMTPTPVCTLRWGCTFHLLTPIIVLVLDWSCCRRPPDLGR